MFPRTDNLEQPVRATATRVAIRIGFAQHDDQHKSGGRHYRSVQQSARATATRVATLHYHVPILVCTFSIQEITVRNHQRVLPCDGMPSVPDHTRLAVSLKQCRIFVPTFCGLAVNWLYVPVTHPFLFLKSPVQLVRRKFAGRKNQVQRK